MELLTFKLQGVKFGISVTQTESVELQVNVTPVPDTPRHIRGIMDYHGEIIPVYSLASRFGMEAQSVNNIVVVRVGGSKVGFEVETVDSILSPQEDAIIPMPGILNATQDYFNTVIAYRDELITVLDVEKLVTEDERKRISDFVEAHN